MENHFRGFPVQLLPVCRVVLHEMDSPRISHHFCIFTVLLCLVSTVASFTYAPPRSDEICGSHNGRKLYLDLGDSGTLKASFVNEALLEQINRASHSQCSLEIVTCPACVITATFKYLNLSSCSSDSSCRCDYVWLTEPPYESSGAPFCGSSSVAEGSSTLAYRSLTRTLHIAYLYSSRRKDAFEIEYRAERNKQVLGLSPSPVVKYPLEYNATRGGELSSPYFPANYPRDLGIEFIITSMDQKSNVQVIFSDFQVSSASIIEFYDWNGQRIDVTSGASFRPPIIISSGPSLLIRFYANGGFGLGFKATYTFLTSEEASKNQLTLPDTDCGGFVENPGGAITMMQMAEEGHLKYFDCIWIIKPPRNYFNLKSHLYLKISQFSDFGGNTDLVVRQGLTSEGVTVENLRSPVSEASSRLLREMIIPVDVGFYISLRGVFSSRSKLSIVYAAFSYMDCFAGADFLCKNHRCISTRLTCDGFDHCGDNSDEPTTTCMEEFWTEHIQYDKRRYTVTPNYYFPKMERYPDLRTATMVFLVSSLGLVFLVVALIVLLYRMGARARQQRDLQNRLRTINNAGIEAELPLDEPPTYEAPPGYDEIIKVVARRSLELAGPSGPSRGNDGRGRSRNKNKLRGRRRAKSTPGIPTSTVDHVALRVALPRSRSPPVRRASTAWSDDQGGSAPILMHASSNRGTTPIPDSPPPPYMTEPSLAGNFSQDSLFARSALQGAEAVERVPLVRPSLTQELMGTEPNFSEHVISPCSTLDSIPDDPALQPLCKLASVEAFEDLEASRESMVVHQLAPASANNNNFAHFENVDEYPTCGSMTSRCNSHANSLDGDLSILSRSTASDAMSGSASIAHSRHPSSDQLDEIQETVLLPKPPSKTDMGHQLKMLKTQIQEQNAKLAKMKAEEARPEPSTSRGFPCRETDHMLARFIEVVQRRESSCSSSSDDSPTKQFF
ncbi:uncharacterized protein LOC132204719 isoform X2 [Neocloeon triangulifer]|uniref:uncharacterized protein LOC132204719 isoform X2 n=1 Tax=Neocloeon triangulifer TaxID=2078957 RepID=UPI00286F854E|nr:uncharacterized protein LOC132204719 isoform X2 [Neocloeon triangulifer]